MKQLFCGRRKDCIGVCIGSITCFFFLALETPEVSLRMLIFSSVVRLGCFLNVGKVYREQDILTSVKHVFFWVANEYLGFLFSHVICHHFLPIIAYVFLNKSDLCPIYMCSPSVQFAFLSASPPFQETGIKLLSCNARFFQDDRSSAFYQERAREPVLDVFQRNVLDDWKFQKQVKILNGGRWKKQTSSKKSN